MTPDTHPSKRPTIQSPLPAFSDDEPADHADQPNSNLHKFSDADKKLVLSLLMALGVVGMVWGLLNGDLKITGLYALFVAVPFIGLFRSGRKDC